MRKLIPLVVVAVAAALGALWWSQRSPGPFYISGYLEVDEIRVGSRVGGRVAEVRTQDGARVAAGTALARLEPFDLRERLAQAQGQAAAAAAKLALVQTGLRPEEITQARARRDRVQATLDKLIAGPRPLEIQMLESKLAAAAAELAKAQADFDRVERLYQSASASDEERRDVSRLLDVAKARQAEARDALALAREGTRPEDIADARAALAMEEAALKLAESGYREEEVAEAQGTAQAAAAAVAAIERQLAELTITAPADCVVEALDLQPGDLIAPNAPVISLVRDEPLWVRAYVPENRMNLQVGQKVWVRVDALPQRRFAAHVVFVARQAEFTPSNVQTPEERSKQVFRVKVVLDEGRGALRPGMAADVFLEPGT